MLRIRFSGSPAGSIWTSVTPDIIGRYLDPAPGAITLMDDGKVNAMAAVGA